MVALSSEQQQKKSTYTTEFKWENNATHQTLDVEIIFQMSRPGKSIVEIEVEIIFQMSRPGKSIVEIEVEIIFQMSRPGKSIVVN